jgi:hypothetical protein
LVRPTGFGRPWGIESRIERQEAAERRLSSSVRQAESVDAALRALDQQLADIGQADNDESLRASARALLVVAFRTADYDVTLLPASRAVGLRVRNTTFGLQAEVTETPETADNKGEDAQAEVTETAETAETADSESEDRDVMVAGVDD